MPTEPESEKIPQELKTWLDSTTKEFNKCYLRPRVLESIIRVLLLVLLAAIAFWGAKELFAWLFLREETPLLYALGSYHQQVYLFNQSTQKVYRYNAQTGQELEAFDLFPYDAFAWSPGRSKIVFISRERNELGGLYVVDLAQSPSHLVLITERETGINFPSDVVIQGNLPLAWNDSADRITFVARKQTEEKDALFVIAADGSEYYRLPEMERITSLAWADDKIVFVALENGREKRFVVNCDGGALKEVK